jgi:antitoxin (DNA-binding transcriptional repressor) of toxin-antitoxin stability system
MVMIRTTLEEAKAQLNELFDAALRGEEVLIADENGDDRVVRLVVDTRNANGPEFGSGKGLFRMADNFDDPLPDFDEYQ